MLEIVGLPLACFKETVNPSAFLCSLCDGLATKTLKFQEEIRKIKETVAEKVARLTKLSNPRVTPDIPGGTADQQRKRCGKRNSC